MRGRSAFVSAVLLGGLLAAGAFGLLARQHLYRDRPLPGVVVAKAPLDGTLAVRVGDHTFGVRPGEALEVDAAATRAAALKAGRSGIWNRLVALASPSPLRREVPEVLRPTTGADVVLRRFARDLVQPRQAVVRATPTGPVVTPSRPGEVIDRGRFLASLGLGRPFTVTLRSVDPRLDTAAAEQAAATARELAAERIALTFQGRPVGWLEPDRLARLLRFAPRGDRFLVSFDPGRLALAVKPAVTPWRKRATNARFRVLAGGGVRLLPSRPGLDVAPDSVLDAVTAAAYSASGRTAELALHQVRADLTTAEAERLGIRERVSTFTTDMGTSSSNRIHNVHLMADYIDGTIVRPGELFSFNGSVGPRTSERGFLEGQMIIGSLLLPAIGGGVCQTATTLFNNAFDIGLPIVERHNHSFFISHYPLGRDATVSWGGPDLKFRNDLKTGILIKARYTSSTLTFQFYGTKADRRVSIAVGPKVNWRTPRVSYALDPYAPHGSVRTVAGSNQSGFDVTVYRRVYEDGKLLRKDSVTSNYVAVGPTQIYGPGRSIPGSYFVLPRI